MKPHELDRDLGKPLEAGVDVRDRKRPQEGNVGVVLDVTGLPAEDVYVEAIEATVAEANPKYPADDIVVEMTWDGEKAYHYPASRLIREDEIVDVHPDELQPSPLHDRSFDREENESYIKSVQHLGYVESVITARVVEEGYEIVDGHKRAWVSREAGLGSVPVWLVQLSAKEADDIYRQFHDD